MNEEQEQTDGTELRRLKAENESLLAETVDLRVAQEEHERFFNLSLDMLCISKSDGYFKRVSPAFTTTLGWSVEELLTIPFLDLVHPDDHEATMREVERQVIAGKMVLEFENRYKHKDGSWRILSWKSIPQPDGYMYATARDVTETKRAQSEISELNRSLQVRAVELEMAKSEAERANRAKNEFLSRMSHELRTPMNSVIGFAQLMDLQTQDPETKKNARAIFKAGQHLLSLINEVLDLARIEAGKLAVSLEPVPVGLAIGQAIDLVGPAAEARNVVLKVHPEPCSQLHVLADRQRLVQVLLNLLSNAVKFNRQGGRVQVRCFEASSGMHRIEVSDTGHGIPEMFRGELFKPFERFMSDEVEGTGLGLALSRSLMKLMGGTIALGQTGSEGTTFVIELRPAEAPDQVLPIPPKGLATSDPGKLVRIVYIEDNLSNLQLMEDVLEFRGGVELSSAMDASGGLRLVRERQPDLVLLDLHLPDAHGIEVLADLRADPTTADIPVIILSADATETQIKRLLAAGAKSYLTKPIDLAALFAELKDITPRVR